MDEIECEIHCVCRGEGAPVLLIHGLAASHRDWETLAPALSEAGYCAYAVDLPGHGESALEADPDGYDAGAILHMLVTWIAGLHLQVSPVLIGHSLGGYFSLRYAAAHPVAGLVLVDPFFSRRQLRPVIRFLYHDSDLVVRVARRAPDWLVRPVMSFGMNFTEDLPQAVRRQAVADYLSASPEIFYTAATIEEDTSWLQEVCAPALVLWGARDLTLLPASFPELLEVLPNAMGLVLPKAGHQPHLSHPEIVDPAVLRFLAEQRFRLPGLEGRF